MPSFVDRNALDDKAVTIWDKDTFVTGNIIPGATPTGRASRKIQKPMEEKLNQITADLAEYNDLSVFIEAENNHPYDEELIKDYPFDGPLNPEKLENSPEMCIEKLRVEESDNTFYIEHSGLPRSESDYGLFEKQKAAIYAYTEELSNLEHDADRIKWEVEKERTQEFVDKYLETI